MNHASNINRVHYMYIYTILRVNFQFHDKSVGYKRFPFYMIYGSLSIGAPDEGKQLKFICLSPFYASPSHFSLSFEENTHLLSSQ